MIGKTQGVFQHLIIIFLLLAAVWVSAAERASFGMIVKPVSDEYARFIGLDGPEGAYVVSTPASGGLRPGDVILKVDDAPIKTPADLQEVIRVHQPGDQVQLMIARGKERVQISYALKSAASSGAGFRPGQAARMPSGLGSFPTIESRDFEKEVLKSERPVLAYF